MSTASEPLAAPNGLIRKRIEFVLFFVAVPVAIAVFFPPSWMFPALFAVTGLGLVLLFFTDGFRWRSLFAGVSEVNLAVVTAVGIMTGIASFLILQATAPQTLFSLLQAPLPRVSNGWPLIVMIALFYPIVSALPQELVFRVLYFRRYADVLPRQGALTLNAALFSMAHLMYWSWIVAGMTFVGGLIFAWSYERRGNFPEAVLLHAVAGVVLFAFGMGAYFYSGNVVRPF